MLFVEMFKTEIHFILSFAILIEELKNNFTTEQPSEMVPIAIISNNKSKANADIALERFFKQIKSNIDVPDFYVYTTNRMQSFLLVHCLPVINTILVNEPMYYFFINSKKL